MRRCHLVALLVACLTVPATLAVSEARAQTSVITPIKAPPRPAVGVGEQDPLMFQNPLFQRLGLRQAHHLVGWDVTEVGWQRERLAAFLQGAAANDVNVLVAFGVSSMPKRRHTAPSVKTYRRAFMAFRKQFPQVTNFVIWNEANHCSQPVCHKPQRVARYFEVARAACRKCRLVGADVLDSPSMRTWIRGFKSVLRHRPDAWGLHNYIDANRRQTTNTRWMLANTRGPVWFTETGGLVRRRTTSPIKFPQGLTHATKTTRYLLNRLGTLSPRIKRIYLYHFTNHGVDKTWDSGLLNPHGSPRPAFLVLERWLMRAGRLPSQRPRS